MVPLVDLCLRIEVDYELNVLMQVSVLNLLCVCVCVGKFSSYLQLSKERLVSLIQDCNLRSTLHSYCT